MKIATWNVNMKAGYKDISHENFIHKVCKTIFDQNVDVFVITEIAFSLKWNEYTKNRTWESLESIMKEKGYIGVHTIKDGRNGILILVKKDLLKNVENLSNGLIQSELWYNGCVETFHLETNDSVFAGYHILKITFDLKLTNKKSKPCSIIGVRMLSNPKKNQDQKYYEDTGKVFGSKVIPIVGACDSDIVIVAGDFNNGAWHQKDNSTNGYSGMDHEKYNWHVIKEAFDDENYIMCDYDCGYSHKDNNNWHSDCVFTRGFSPIDHIFVKGLVKDINFKPKGHKYCDVFYDSNLSDHKILIAGVEIQQDEEKTQ